MSYATLPISFWAIEIMVYLLNMVPSKFVSKVPKELWLGHKLSVNHIWIWGCLAHVLKGKTNKPKQKYACLWDIQKEQRDIWSIVLRISMCLLQQMLSS